MTGLDQHDTDAQRPRPPNPTARPAGSVHNVRTALKIAGASLLVTALAGCSGQSLPTATPPPTSAPVPTPSMWTPDPTQAPPEATGLTSPAPSSPTEPSPTQSLPPVEKPSPQGGPWEAVDLTATTAEQLTSGALPETLAAFLATRIGVEDDFGCTTSEFVIKAVHPDGYAFGTEDADCGGGQVIWGVTEQQWNYIVAFGDAMPCRDLALNEIPTGAPGLRCLDDSGDARDY